jgi:hypothetical protein
MWCLEGKAMFETEREIGDWRGRLAASGNLGEERLEELESHLRDSMDELRGRGLDEEEAFLVAVHRIGNLDELGRECAQAVADESWRRIALEPAGTGRAQHRRDLLLTLGLSLGAGLSAKLPSLFGIEPGINEGGMVYARNLALFCLPAVAWLLALLPRPGRDSPGWRCGAGFSAVAFGLACFINLFPWAADSQTLVLSALHLPFFLWLALLPLYAGDRWREAGRGMDFVRFTGEAFVYGVLVFCGLMVLAAFMAMLFSTAGLELEGFLESWLLPVGACAIPVAASRLSLAKRNVVETIAPLLARIFAPLFLLGILSFIALTLLAGRDPFSDRDALIVFDLVLAMVWALVLWSAAMRDPRASPGPADWVDLGLVLAALLLDAFLLAAMAGRIGTWGLSPNRVAALGENLVLLAGLSGTAFHLGRHLLGKGGYGALLRWQTAFLAVIFAWMGLASLVLPLLFGGR